MDSFLRVEILRVHVSSDLDSVNRIGQFSANAIADIFGIEDIVNNILRPVDLLLPLTHSILLKRNPVNLHGACGPWAYGRDPDFTCAG